MCLPKSWSQALMKGPISKTMEVPGKWAKLFSNQIDFWGGRTRNWGLRRNQNPTQEFKNGIILDVPNRRQLSFWRSSQSQLLTAAAQAESEEGGWSVTSHFSISSSSSRVTWLKLMSHLVRWQNDDNIYCRMIICRLPVRLHTLHCSRKFSEINYLKSILDKNHSTQILWKIPTILRLF